VSAALSSTRPAPADTRVTLVAESVAHRYSARRGLAPLSFRATAPSLVAVVGENGAGKSTLLRMVAGLLRPTSGTLECSGAEGGVGYAAPDLAFYVEMSAEENLAFAAEARGLHRTAVREALERVELTSRARDRVSDLSSGLQQRLRLAFALLGHPSLLVLDEPGSHLDERGRTVLSGILDEHRTHGLVLMATNDEREWRRADSKIEIRAGGLGDPA
jgi:heme exporter protein A